MIHSLSLAGHGRIHAETEGSGDTVLFIHADFVDARMWDAVRHRLSGFRTAAYDKLGYGRSDATGPVSRRAELETVVESLKLAPAHLVGCSNGGRQALDFALLHPGLVRSLTLVNASPSGWEPEGAPPAPVLAMIEAAQRGDLAEVSERQLQIWFDGPGRGAGHEEPLRTARALAGTMNRIFVERGTFFTAPDLDPGEPALGRLASVAVPTLVVDGRGDWPENRRASKLLAQGIPGARLVEIEGAHVPPLEQPELFADLLTEFLKAVPV